MPELDGSDTFGLDTYNDELKAAVKAAHVFLSALHAGEPIWLSLLGNCGVGKTHLAMEVYRQFKPSLVKRQDPNSASGFRGHQQKKQKFSWTYIVKKMRGGDFGIIDYVCDDVDLVVIDDIGAGYDSDLTKAKASEIADRRIGKPTIWTSNLDLAQIADQIDARLTSRLLRHGSQVVVFDKTEDWGIIQHRKSA